MPIKTGCWIHRDSSGLADAVDFEHDLETGVFLSLATSGRGVAEGKGVFAIYDGSKVGTVGTLVGFTDFIGAYRWLDGADIRSIEHCTFRWGDPETIADKAKSNGHIKKKRRTS